MNLVLARDSAKGSESKNYGPSTSYSTIPPTSLVLAPSRREFDSDPKVRLLLGKSGGTLFVKDLVERSRLGSIAFAFFFFPASFHSLFASFVGW